MENVEVKSKTIDPNDPAVQEKIAEYRKQNSGILNAGRSLDPLGEMRQSVAKNKEQANAPQVNMPNFLDTDSTQKQKELNTQDTQEVPMQESTPANMFAPDVMETTRYEKFRNTGVAYFDKKKDLSLLDAYMAKQLGLNVSYNFHKIDLKSDNTNFNQNAQKQFNTFNSAWANSKTGAITALNMMGKDPSIAGYIGKAADKTFGGLVNFGVNEKLNALTQTQTIIATLAQGGRPLADQQKKANEIAADSTYNRERAIEISTTILQQNIIDMETSLATLETSGRYRPEQLAMYRAQLNTARRAHTLLKEARNNPAKLQENALLLASLGF